MMMPLRSLRKTPGLSITVVLLLGFGIGANTALFSLCRALLLRPIPGVRDSGELVRVRRTQYGHSQVNQSYPDYIAFRDRSKTIAGLAAERLVSLAGPAAQIVQGARPSRGTTSRCWVRLPRPAAFSDPRTIVFPAGIPWRW
jgi:hypothetical protein